METGERGKLGGAYFTDTHSPGHVLTLEQLDYDNAKFPMDSRDQAAIEALALGETYVVQHAYEEDDGEAPTWGTITRLPADTTVRALVRNGVVLGMGFDDAAAHKDAGDRGADPLDVAAGEYIDGTLAALSGWTDILIGPEYVCVDYDGCVHRIDVDDVAEEDKGTPNDPGWYRDDEEHSGAAPGAEPSEISKLVKAGDSRGLWKALLATLPRCSNECGRAARFRMTYTSHFSCGMTDRGCEAPDGDEWEEAPWKAHVELPSDAPAGGPYTMRWADDLGNDTPGSDMRDETDPTGFFTYDPTGESLVDDLVAEALVERDLKKALAKHVLFTVAGKAGIFQTKAAKADMLARTLADPGLAQKLKADKILNLLPLGDALVLYKAGTRPGQS